MKKNPLPKANVDEWFAAIFTYIEKFLLSPTEIDDDESFKIGESMVNAMAGIGEYFAGKYRANDSVTVGRYHEIQETHLRFEKLNTEIAFGFDHHCFYVNNTLSFQNNLKSANDSFWSRLLSLSELGKVKYDRDFPERGGVGKDLNSVLRQNTSASLRIAGGFLLNLADDAHRGDYINRIEIEIEKTKSRKELFTRIEACIDAFQSLNYQLYHIEYLSARRSVDNSLKR
jgi:hypothetical protein